MLREEEVAGILDLSGRGDKPLCHPDRKTDDKLPRTDGIIAAAGEIPAISEVVVAKPAGFHRCPERYRHC